MKILKLAALLLASSMALAEVPQLINYQGMLTDAQGNPKLGTANLSFTIFDAATGTNKLWGPQTFTSVPLINGSFNIILGSTDSNGAPIGNAFQAENSFLEITDTGLLASTSDDTVISPRQQILSAPYALHAKNADYAIHGVPPGAIMPFNLGACPTGWTPYSSGVNRFIVGANSGGAVGSTGGSSTATLSISNMPAHQHDTSRAGLTTSNYAHWGLGGTKIAIQGGEITTLQTLLTSPVGGGAAFSIMPPYVALLYCEKI